MILEDIVFTFEHIRGHQDRTTAYKKLPRIAQLNVQMDSLAKKFMASQIAKLDRIGDYVHVPMTVVRIGNQISHFGVGPLLRYDVGTQE